MTQPGNPRPRTSPFLLRTRNLWRALALFLTVGGVRFWLVERYATPLPCWDQWDGIGVLILKLNGQWDEWLEMAVNAVFCGFGAVCLAGMLISELGKSHARKIFLAVGLYFVLPFGGRTPFAVSSRRTSSWSCFPWLRCGDWSFARRVRADGGWDWPGCCWRA